jgi:hypothetical protein
MAADLNIKYFYLFDEELNVKEGREHEKLLYYWPPETDIQVQTKVLFFSLSLSLSLLLFLATAHWLQ